MTRHAPEPGTPSGGQRGAVERARELHEAAATVQTLTSLAGALPAERTPTRPAA